MESTNIDRILRPAEAARKLGLERTTLFRMVKRGDLPPSIKITKKAVGWRESTLEAYIAQRAQVA